MPELRSDRHGEGRNHNQGPQRRRHVEVRTVRSPMARQRYSRGVIRRAEQRTRLGIEEESLERSRWAFPRMILLAYPGMNRCIYSL